MLRRDWSGRMAPVLMFWWRHGTAQGPGGFGPGWLPSIRRERERNTPVLCHNASPPARAGRYIDFLPDIFTFLFLRDIENTCMARMEVLL